MYSKPRPAGFFVFHQMDMQQKTVWVVCGPTASGKTRLAINLATKRSCEILSFDSRQVFKEMNIGVARPSTEELSEVPHHFIASHSILEAFSAGRFAREAKTFLHSYLSRKDEIVLCGGTGLYLKALLSGMDRLPVPEPIRNSVRDLFQKEGLEGLKAAIEKESQSVPEELDWNNPNRLIRFLEWTRAGSPSENPEPWPENWKVRKLAPLVDREWLYQRINQRVEGMVAQGLWEEASGLFPLRNLVALQTVGYQEIFDCLEGLYSREEAIEKIKQHTRNYAKRQMTWFRRDPEIEWLKPEDQAAWLESLDSHGSGTGSK